MIKMIAKTITAVNLKNIGSKFKDEGLQVIGEMVGEYWFAVPKTTDILKMEVLRTAEDNYRCFANFKITFSKSDNPYKGEGEGETAALALEDAVRKFLVKWKSFTPISDALL